MLPFLVCVRGSVFLSFWFEGFGVRGFGLNILGSETLYLPCVSVTRAGIPAVEKFNIRNHVFWTPNP